MCYARRQRSSWARIKLSKKLYLKYPFGYLKSSRAIYLSFTFVWVVFSINSDEISISHLQCFVLFSCCSIFNDQFCLPHCCDSAIIPHHYSLVNTFLKIFLKVFWCSSPIWVACAILVGQQGLEPRTNRLWAGCSNQLSYWPKWATCLLYNTLFYLSRVL